MRICAALADAGAEAKRRSFRFGRRRRCLPSRQSALSRCAASDEPKCLFAFTDGPKAPSAASTAAHCLLSAHTAQCAAGQAEIGAQMNTRRQRDCPLQQKRKRRRVRRERLRGGLPVANAPAFARKQNASALFFARRRKGVSPAPPHMEYRYARGIPEKQAARTQLALMCGKIRHRLPPLCTEASDCETEASEPIPPKPFARFGATYRETARQKAAKRFSLRTKKRLRRAAADAYCSPVFFASR